MITEKQLCNIHKLSTDDCLLISRECAERAGVVSVDEYSKTFKIPKRTIYDHMNQGKIKYLEISSRKFPCVNFN